MVKNALLRKRHGAYSKAAIVYRGVFINYAMFRFTYTVKFQSVRFRVESSFDIPLWKYCYL